MKVALLTPPFTDLNTPYPATTFLTGFLEARGQEVVQKDIGIEVIQRLFSRNGLQRMQAAILSQGELLDLSVLHDSEEIAEPVIHFLKSSNAELAHRILSENFFSEAILTQLRSYQGLRPMPAGKEQSPIFRAQYIASQFFSLLVDIVRKKIDPGFHGRSYWPDLMQDNKDFSQFETYVNQPATLVTKLLEEALREFVAEENPGLIGITAPFRGTVFGALQSAKLLREIAPRVPRVLGGGFVNCEMRELNAPKFFEYFDFLTLDDGERPLLYLMEYLEGKRSREELCRTKMLVDKQVIWIEGKKQKAEDLARVVPSYRGIDRSKYLSWNQQFHDFSMLTNGRDWNKLMMAHGCYWGKCTFCDTHLDYVSRYEPSRASDLLYKVETLIEKTGISSFHFVDEAAPPALIRAFSEAVIKKKMKIQWWSNLRFDRAFTPSLCALMAEAGCVGVTAGLETASDRVLKLMKKGTSVDQVIQVAKAFADHGILVHSYLIYGFPSQTLQESIDSFEIIRQMFQAGILHSGAWHRFNATSTSDIGHEPEKFGIQSAKEAKKDFTNYSLSYSDPSGFDLIALGRGLNQGLFWYRNGYYLGAKIKHWFPKEFAVPETNIPGDFVASRLSDALQAGSRG